MLGRTTTLLPRGFMGVRGMERMGENSRVLFSKRRISNSTTTSSLLTTTTTTTTTTNNNNITPMLPPTPSILTPSTIGSALYTNGGKKGKGGGSKKVEVVPDLPVVYKQPPSEVFHVPKNDQEFWTWLQGGYTRGITAMKKSIHLYREMLKQIHHPYFYQLYQTEEMELEEWFSLAVFHFWITNVIVRGIEGKDALQYSKGIYEMFWNELEERILDGGVRDVWGTSFIIDRRLKQYLNVYLGMMLALDEGLVRGDTVLAEAISRNVLIGNHHSAQTAQFLVQYARQQIAQIKKEEDLFMYHAHINWIDLDGKKPIFNESLEK